MNGFKAMFGKEWRQNIKWAVLGLLGLALALAIAVSRNLPHNQPNNGMDSSMYFGLWNSVTTVYAFAPSLIALLLGLLQILPEQRRDLWAFLVHRPASRATLFWGKVAAGLVLYAGATLVPLLAFALWARTPGNIAGPFDWHLLLGALCGILLGIMFYFAALLTALRPARWWGSRALPVPAAVAVAFVLGFFAVTANFPLTFPLWLAVVIYLGFIALFSLAARGAFLTSGHYETQPRSARAALGGVLYLGVTMVVIVFIGLIVALLNIVFPQSPPKVTFFPQYAVTWSGQIVSYEFNGDPAGNTIRDVHVLDGKPLRLLPGETAFSQNDLLDMQYLPEYISGESDESQNPIFPQHYIVATSLTNPGINEPSEQWYYVQNAHQFQGYYCVSRRLFLSWPISSVSKNGQPIGQLVRSDNSLLDYVYPIDSLYCFQNALYRFNPALFAFIPTELPVKHSAFVSIDSIRSDLFSPKLDYAIKSVDYPVLLTNSRIYVLSDQGQYLFSVPTTLPGTKKKWENVEASVAPDGKHFYFWYDETHLREYNTGGVMIYQADLPRLPTTYAVEPMQFGESLIGLLIPPSLVTMFARPILAQHQFPAWLKLFLALSGLAGMVSAVLTWRISLRCADSRVGRWAWAVGVFLLGLLGVLMLLALRGWPARETCPNCRRLRVVTRERCEHCGAFFAPVALDGTEIYEEDAVLAG